MNIYAPDYYNDFKCIADKCRHNCCIGWEIDVDDETYEYYKNIKGSFRKKILDNIIANDEGHCFLLKNNKCPFLNQKNLCEIIINIGESALCQICTDHPRFRNFFETREEIGLGFCCEAVAALVIKKESKTKIVQLTVNDYDGEVNDIENRFFIYRQKLLNILQNREKILDDRLYELLNYAEVVFPDINNSKWIENFLELEYMGEELKNMISTLEENFISVNLENFDTCFEQIAVYFIYRYLSNTLYGYSLKQYIAFTVLNTLMIKELFKTKILQKKQTCIEDLIEIVRLYSSEIEYSEDNVKKILDWLSE